MNSANPKVIIKWNLGPERPPVAGTPLRVPAGGVPEFAGGAPPNFFVVGFLFFVFGSCKILILSLGKLICFWLKGLYF